jgi:hypothetical protein
MKNEKTVKKKENKKKKGKRNKEVLKKGFRTQSGKTT